MTKTHFTEEQIIEVLRLAEAGQKVAEVCRAEVLAQADLEQPCLPGECYPEVVP